jgi:hypothetical protein
LNRIAKIPIAILVAAIILAMTFPMARASAGQSTPSVVVKQEVADNPSDHTAPVQPILYSHKEHLALHTKCANCHTNPAPGNLMTFPATTTCMSCHRTVRTSKPGVQKLATYMTSRQPIPWVRVYRVMPGVTWSHKKHLDAGMKCEMCHGQVADMEVMSEATSVTSMGVCMRCHAQHKVATVCATCHVWPLENPNP